MEQASEEWLGIGWPCREYKEEGKLGSLEKYLEQEGKRARALLERWADIGNYRGTT